MPMGIEIGVGVGIGGQNGPYTPVQLAGIQAYHYVDYSTCYKSTGPNVLCTAINDNVVAIKELKTGAVKPITNGPCVLKADYGGKLYLDVPLNARCQNFGTVGGTNFYVMSVNSMNRVAGNSMLFGKGTTGAGTRVYQTDQTGVTGGLSAAITNIAKLDTNSRLAEPGPSCRELFYRAGDGGVSGWNGKDVAVGSITTFLGNDTVCLWDIPAGGFPWAGRYYAATVAAGPPTEAIRLSNRLWGYDKIGVPEVVCDGNSLVAGSGSTAGNTYPEQLKALLDAQYGADVIPCWNFGVPSTTTVDRQNSFKQSTGSVLGKNNNTLIMWELTNDIATGTTGTQAIANYQAYKAYVIAQKGCRVVLSTAIPRYSFSAPQNVEKAVANDYYVAQYPISTSNAYVWKNSAGDYCLMLHLIPELQTNNATYYADGVHLKDAGYALIAAVAYACLRMIYG